ncbi:sensor histidine kinase [Nocardioides sp. R-C-SC26]|uniref:sensor histidine kinase n=1 Tax=Nocardioides sp. R-C-SC26 TaxID=2870414 RepID=UPI001E46B35C|nr:histidine kinase [Nocardioides sp. R-C-SC26]
MSDSPVVWRTAVRLRDHIESKAGRFGLAYPWWIPVTATIALLSSAAVGAGQHGVLLPPSAPALALLLIATPCVTHFFSPQWMAWWLEALLVTSGVAWLLTQPFSGDTVDVLPATLMVMVGEITTMSGTVRGLLAAAAAAALVVWLGDYRSDLTLLYLGALVFGVVFGQMLRWMMRALVAEQTARAEERQRATLDERQRVAREIHDLVAHSLSVTMLHVTGARRSLAEDADIPDAIDALTDAERIGRQAMADIRSTVSVLADGSTTGAAAGDVLRPLPTARDIPELVAEVRGAGLDLDFAVDGDLTALSDATGLGLYRVVQESLSNIAKHAPGSSARGRLLVTAQQTHLSIVNPIPVGARLDVGGSGVTGMTSRVTQLGGDLHVGPDDDGLQWRVDLAVPMRGTGSAPHRCVVRRLLP